MKKATITWQAISGADGYFTYSSRYSNPLESLGVSIDPMTVLHNLNNNDVVNFGVQAFQLQTINGVERRVPGVMAVVQIDTVNSGFNVFSDTSLTSINIETV